jgi:hypothetical protein
MKLTSIISATVVPDLSNGRGRMPRLLTRCDVGKPDCQLGAPGRAEIGGEWLSCASGGFGDGAIAQPRGSRSGLDDHPRTLGGQCLGDGEADAGGGAGDERQLAGELQIHGVPFCRCSGRDVDHDLADGRTLPGGVRVAPVLARTGRRARGELLAATSEAAAQDGAVPGR